MQQEQLHLSVQEVIIQRCCKPLPVWTLSPGDDSETDSTRDRKGPGVFSAASLSVLLQRHAQEHLSTLGIFESQSDTSSESEASAEDRSATPTSLSTSPNSSQSLASSSSSSTFLLTPSALSFLKSHSPLLATLACLSACKGEAGRAQSSGWSGYFRTARKEAVLESEHIAREADHLLKGFPVLWDYLRSMAEPVLGPRSCEDGEESPGLGAAVCGKPLIGLLLSGPREEVAQVVAADAFLKALSSRDLGRALRLLELYGRGCSQEAALRDRLLAFAALQGKFILTHLGSFLKRPFNKNSHFFSLLVFKQHVGPKYQLLNYLGGDYFFLLSDGGGGIAQLFRVQNANLRARVALRSLDKWPLSACRELLEFCLSDPGTETSLRTDLEVKKKELDIYHRVILSNRHWKC